MSPSAVAAASRAAEDSQFVERVLATHASGVLRSELLFMLLQRAHYFSEDTAAERRYYSRLVGEFPDSRFANMAKSRFNPDRTIRKGGVAPDFSVAALDDSTIVYTKQSFAGRYLLLDFWATWCGPCIGELGKLTEAVEKYRGDRLEVLSLSFDATPGKVREFRAGKWKMPWLHTFVARGFANQLARSFEVSGIPRPILIDPEGRIVALETELRGSRLAKTLAKFLGDTAQR
jgi:thiol-disulfide isomerase/thioredoxin